MAPHEMGLVIDMKLASPGPGEGAIFINENFTANTACSEENG